MYRVLSSQAGKRVLGDTYIGRQVRGDVAPHVRNTISQECRVSHLDCKLC